MAWFTVIGGYAQNKRENKALTLFKQMQEEIIQPNEITFTVVLSIYGHLGAFSIGREIHSQINKSGIEWSVNMKTSLLNMYIKCGYVDKACAIFDNIESRDIVSWNSIIRGYVQNKRAKKALTLFKKMQEERIQPNEITFTVVLSICGHLRALSLGRKIHSQINKNGMEWSIHMKNSLLNMYINMEVLTKFTLYLII